MVGARRPEGAVTNAEVSNARVSVTSLISRGVRMRCPRCGEGPVFRRWYAYKENRSCPRCGLVYDPRGESLAFMYLSTAFLTGLMFIVLITMPPQRLEVYRFGLVLGALLLYGATMPIRKGLAIAFNYFNSR